MKISIDGFVREMTPEEESEFEASFTPTLPESYTIYKTSIWMNLSDSEAEIVMDAKESQPAKFRGLWDDALTIKSDSQFFDILKSFLTTTLSAKRAAELLVP